MEEFNALNGSVSSVALQVTIIGALLFSSLEKWRLQNFDYIVLELDASPHSSSGVLKLFLN